MKPQLTRHIVETMIQDAFVYRLLNRNLSLPAISKCFFERKKIQSPKIMVFSRHVQIFRFVFTLSLRLLMIFIEIKVLLKMLILITVILHESPAFLPLGRDIESFNVHKIKIRSNSNNLISSSEG